MITFFTDDAERDVLLVQALHATRTLHHVCTVRTDADLRTAVALAVAEPGQLVVTYRRSYPVQRLAFILSMLGIAWTDVDRYLNADAAPAEASPNDWKNTAAVRATPVAPMPFGLPH